MSYVGLNGRPLGSPVLGCGGSCGCTSCRGASRRLGETYIDPEGDDDEDPESADDDKEDGDDNDREAAKDDSDPRPTRRGGRRRQRARARGRGRVRQRGRSRLGGWPAGSRLGEAPCASACGPPFCVRGVAGVPFLRVHPGVPRFTPMVGRMLERFMSHMRHASLPMSGGFTMRSLVCRCQHPLVRGTIGRW